MYKLFVIGSAVVGALAERIPLKKKELTMDNLVAYEQKLEQGAPKKFLTSGYEEEVPVSDYMNTQYFVEV
jgi:hypothetical protein